MMQHSGNKRHVLRNGTHSSHLAIYSWPAAITILAIIIIVEAVPLVLGTGEAAIIDWSFFYVTFRFILLPAACALHVVINVVLLFVRRKRPLGSRLFDFASILVSVCFLVMWFLYPLPFFLLLT